MKPRRISMLARLAGGFSIAALIMLLASAGWVQVETTIQPEADAADKAGPEIKLYTPEKDSVVLAFMMKEWKHPWVPDEILLKGDKEFAGNDFSEGDLQLSADNPDLLGRFGSCEEVPQEIYDGREATFFCDRNDVRLIELDDANFTGDTIILSKVSQHAAKKLEKSFGKLQSVSEVVLGAPAKSVQEALDEPSMKSLFEGYEILWYFEIPEETVNTNDTLEVISRESNAMAYVVKDGVVVEIWRHYWSRLDESQKTKKINPLVCDHLLLGGPVDGKWRYQEFLSAYVQGGEKYRVYSAAKLLGTAVGGRAYYVHEPGENDGTGWVDLQAVDNNGNEIDVSTDSRFVISIGGEWDALPRKAQKLSCTSPTYKDIVKQVLIDKKLDVKDVTVTKVRRIDLEGDGVDEVIISAASNREDREDSFFLNKNDYSFVALRKIIDGKLVTLVLDGQFSTENYTESPAAWFYNIAGILDLDGDGTLEIILSWKYYEGNGYQVYDSKDGKNYMCVCGSGVGE